MTIRNKLTLLFSIIFAAILLMFAFTIYYSYNNDKQEVFYKHLKQQATTKLSLLYDVNIDPKVLQVIYKKSQNSLLHEEVAIYDVDFHLLYHDAVEIDFVKETKSMIDEIVQKKEIRFWREDHQIIGFTLQNEGKTYVITAAGVDEYGNAKLINLRYTIIISFLFSILIIVIAGRFFSKQALKPVSDMVDKVEEITATNLDLRVDEGNKKDEIAELAITFNRMLNRLETSFDSQKQFVSNISHELRTPLSAIITELEISANKERSIKEYKAVIQDSLLDARKLAKLSNSILDLAKASYHESEINFKEVRLDEILLDAEQEVKKLHPEYRISVQFESELSDQAVNFNGNEYLLKTAFVNLIENACKFSKDKHCNVSISFQDQKTTLTFSDNGIGIPTEDIGQLFTPFYRGKNKGYAEGNGIGLSLTKKIVLLHKGKITLSSTVNKGTEFVISF